MIRLIAIAALAGSTSLAHADETHTFHNTDAYDLGKAYDCAFKDCSVITFETTSMPTGAKALSIQRAGSEICYQLQEGGELRCRLDGVKALVEDAIRLAAEKRALEDENKALRAKLARKGRR